MAVIVIQGLTWIVPKQPPRPQVLTGHRYRQQFMAFEHRRRQQQAKDLQHDITARQSSHITSPSHMTHRVPIQADIPAFHLHQ